MPLLTGKASDFLKIAVAAAGRGDMDTVRAVLGERPDWIARIGSHGRTMLWEAAYRGRAETVEYLLDPGADIDARGCHYAPLLVDISPYCAARKRDAAHWLDAMACAVGCAESPILNDAEYADPRSILLTFGTQNYIRSGRSKVATL